MSSPDSSGGSFTESSSDHVQSSTTSSPEPPVSSSESPPPSSSEPPPPSSSTSDPQPSSDTPPPSSSSTRSPEPPSSSSQPTSSDPPPSSSDTWSPSPQPSSSPSTSQQQSSSDDSSTASPSPSGSSGSAGSTASDSSSSPSPSSNSAIVSSSQAPSLSSADTLLIATSSSAGSASPTILSATSTAPSLSAIPSSLIETTIGSITTTDEHGRMTTKAAPSEITSTIIGTDTNGRVWTVTQIIKNTGVADESSAHGGSGFFDNAGAVAGTFVVVGLAVAAGILVFSWLALRRRRRQRLDRDVSAAAAAAAAANQPRFEDDDEPSMTQYGSYYTTTHGSADGIEQPNAMRDYMDPSGGYDPYANHLAQPMIPGDRPCSTATAPGVAGIGATPERVADGGYANNGGYDPNHFAANAYDQNAFAADGPDFSNNGDPQYDVAHQYAAHESTYNAGNSAPSGPAATKGYEGFDYSNTYGTPTAPYSDDAFAAPERAGQFSTGYGQTIPR